MLGTLDCALWFERTIADEPAAERAETPAVGLVLETLLEQPVGVPRETMRRWVRTGRVRWRVSASQEAGRNPGRP